MHFSSMPAAHAELYNASKDGTSGYDYRLYWHTSAEVGAECPNMVPMAAMVILQAHHCHQC